MLSDFVKYVRQYWHDRPDKSTPLNAERMNYIENGIESNANAIDEIAKAVVSNIVNDPNKIASMAAVYALQEKLGTGNLPSGTSDVISAINTLNSNKADKTSVAENRDLQYVYISYHTYYNGLCIRGNYNGEIHDFVIDTTNKVIRYYKDGELLFVK